MAKQKQSKKKALSEWAGKNKKTIDTAIKEIKQTRKELKAEILAKLEPKFQELVAEIDPNEVCTNKYWACKLYYVYLDKKKE